MLPGKLFLSQKQGLGTSRTRNDGISVGDKTSGNTIPIYYSRYKVAFNAATFRPRCLTSTYPVYFKETLPYCDDVEISGSTIFEARRSIVIMF